METGLQSYRGGGVMAKIEGWHRRQAMVLAGQLPESIVDARLVLQAVGELLDGFLNEPDPTKKPAPVIALIGRNDCA